MANKEFGENIKKYRLLNNLTQQDLSEKLGIKNKSTVGSWEVGKSEPDFKMISKICKAFNIDANTLLGLSYDKHENEYNKENWQTRLPKISGIDENGKFVQNFSQNDTLEIIKDLANLPDNAMGDLKVLFEFLNSKYNK